MNNQLLLRVKKHLTESIIGKSRHRTIRSLLKKVYWDTYEFIPGHVVLLTINEQGYEVCFRGEKYSLEKQISDDSIRQNIRRLKQRLPFVELVLEEIAVGNKTGRKLRDDYEYVVLCRASDVLPDEI